MDQGISEKAPQRKSLKTITRFAWAILAIFAAVVLLPHAAIFMLSWKTSYTSPDSGPFPVTVDPRRKEITQDKIVDDYLADKHSLLGAAVSDASDMLWNAGISAAAALADAPWNQGIASVGGRFVTISPGLRKEQVANAFGSALGWSAAEERAFLAPEKGADLPLSEGSFLPGTYFVPLETSSKDAQALINQRFSEDILSHYPTSTAEILPLEEALTVASLIQRETISTDGMRLLSGIMWNRIFIGMNLQIDSTLQYAKASKAAVGSWWPSVAPKDKYISSPYNTYLNSGLPPAPIASPSVAAVLAALNPVKTSCLFYFNDKKGKFHCSATYAEHIKGLREYYPN